MQNLALSLLSLVIFFGLAEAGARLAGYSPYPPQAEQFVAEFHQNKRQNIDMFQESATRIWELRPNFDGTRPDWGPRSNIPIRINSQGRRDTEEVSLIKPPGTFRIALLGDSVTMAARVNVEDGFGERLKVMLNAEAAPGRRYEVLNFGTSGYGTWQQLITLREHALAYAPDLIVVGFVLNDVDDNNQARTVGYLDVINARGLAKTLRENSGFYRFLREQILSLRARAQSAGPCAVGVPPFTGVGGDHCWAESLSLLDQIIATGRSHNIPTVLVILPPRWQIDSPDPALDADYQARLAAFAQERGIPAFDVLPLFREHSGEPLFVDDYHPDVTGHVLIAEGLYNTLKQEALIPDSPSGTSR